MTLRGWRLFTVLALAANIVFAILIGLELARRESAQNVMPTAKSKIPGLRDKPITLPPRPGARVETPTTNWPPFRWSSVQSPNYTNYVANLRKIGCPPDTIEAIIRGATWLELATFIHAHATAPVRLAIIGLDLESFLDNGRTDVRRHLMRFEYRIFCLQFDACMCTHQVPPTPGRACTH